MENINARWAVLESAAAALLHVLRDPKNFAIVHALLNKELARVTGLPTTYPFGGDDCVLQQGELEQLLELVGAAIGIPAIPAREARVAGLEGQLTTCIPPECEQRLLTLLLHTAATARPYELPLPSAADFDMEDQKLLQLARDAVATRLLYWQALRRLEKAATGDGEWPDRTSDKVADLIGELAATLNEPRDVANIADEHLQELVDAATAAAA